MAAVSACATALSQTLSPPQPLAGPVARSMASSTARPTLAEAVELAWQRSLEAGELLGQQRRAQAEQASAASWLPASPAIELSQREGQGSAAEGRRETELAVVLPLWRLGQRDAAQRAAQSELDLASSTERAARFRLAMQVREAAGALAVREAEAALANEQRELLQTLAKDVQRRVDAGDLAPVDALAAKAEAIAAQSQAAEAVQQLQSQRAHWQHLTGLSQGPDLQPASTAADSASAAALDAHPELEMARQTLELARHRVAAAQAQRGDSPELGVGVREERPGQGTAGERSVGISLRWPFGTEVHRQPRIAAALAEQDSALASQQRTRARLEADLAVARAQWGTSRAQVEFERERVSLLRERAAHLDKAFRAGEAALPDLLRALSAAAQAELAHARQQAALGVAFARLQYAQGVNP
jgi:cobalt-zinc-cadmium efflux system outer membrane protein